MSPSPSNLYAKKRWKGAGNRLRLTLNLSGNFKKLVAAQIGRAPHEIMLKRQGQRPFRDTITLEDYEIHNGVQLDLELDTGD